MSLLAVGTAVGTWTPPTAAAAPAHPAPRPHDRRRGASANPARASNFVLSYLRSSSTDYEVWPVTPREDEVLGLRAYPSLADLPAAPDIVDVFRRAEDLPGVAEEAVAAGAGTFWAQLGLHADAAVRLAAEAGLEVVTNRCVKIEHARFAGGLHLAGFDTGVISSRRTRARRAAPATARGPRGSATATATAPPRRWGREVPPQPFTDPLSGDDAGRARRRLRHAGALLYAAGAGTLGLVLVSPDPDPSDHVALGACAGLCAALALVLLLWRRAPAAVLHAICPAGSLVTTAAVAVAEPVGLTSIYYLLPLTIAAYFLRPREVVANLVLIAGAYALTLVLWVEPVLRAASWFATLAVLTIIAAVVLVLKAEVVALVDRLRVLASHDALTGALNRGRLRAAPGGGARPQRAHRPALRAGRPGPRPLQGGQRPPRPRRGRRRAAPRRVGRHRRPAPARTSSGGSAARSSASC